MIAVLRTIATVLVGLMAVGAGIAGYTAVKDGTIQDVNVNLSGLADLLSSPTGFLLAKGKETVSFSASLSSDSAQEIRLAFDKPVALGVSLAGSGLLVNNIPINADTVTAYADEYTGRVVISKGVSLDGSAPSLTINSLVMEPEGSLKLEADGIDASVEITGMEKKSFNLIDVQGIITAAEEEGKVTYEKASGNLSIRSFSGSLAIARGVMTLNGTGMLYSETVQLPGAGE